MNLEQAARQALTFIESLTGMRPEVTEERDEISAALREALQEHTLQTLSDFHQEVEQEPVAWQPINTAPRDNKRSLYLARFDEAGRMVELDFNGGWEFCEESRELSHINGWDWFSNSGLEDPTHWAYQDEPLPTAPPVVQQESTKKTLRRGSKLARGDRQETMNGYILPRCLSCASFSRVQSSAHQASHQRLESGSSALQ
jgi:hypothetical protein